LPAPVVDPVMISTSGHDLIGEEAFQILKNDLLRVARLVTPNIPEAERLAGFSIKSEADMKRAAEVIKAFGASAVLVKGGHRLESQADAVDILIDDAGAITEFRAEYIDVGEVHGSGCTLSAAIAANLATGLSLEAAVGAGKRYLTQQIQNLIRS
jgi:hydroxymethylpyrimidine kinase/phosphomethylpyrimidine kinase